jgi:hypothetical protein
VNIFLSKFYCLALLAAVAAPYASGQANVDLADSLRVAVTRFDQTKITRARYTYLDLNHTQNFDEKGKSTVNRTQLFEVTYIGEVQFARLLQQDGRPLEAKALEAEKRRYDDAVREHSALDEKARAKIEHHVMKDAGADLGLLPDHYRNEVVEHATVDGNDCLLIDSQPRPGAIQKHYRIWLDPARDVIVRMQFDQLADEGDLLRGGSGMKTWTYMDNVPLLTASRVDSNVAVGKKRVRVVVDHRYSRFRKFSVTSKVVEVVPDSRGL